MNSAREKIANRQLWFILFMMRSIVILSFLPILASADALQDAWISALITLAGSEVFILLITLIDIKFPELTVVEYSQKLLGSIGGKLLSLVILWIFLQSSVVDIRLYAEVIVTGFMPRTPMIVIIGGMVLAAVVCVYNGIEVLGRAADFLFFVFIVMLLSILFIPLPQVDLKNIQPVLARGWTPVIKGAITPVALILQVWVIVIMGANTLEPRKNIRTATISIGISILILVLVGLITISVIGPYEGARSNFPVLTLMRSVEMGSFLERMEVLIVFGWGLGLFISVSTFLYCGAKGLSQLLNLKDIRPLLLPMALIWVFMGVHGFKDIFSLYEFLQPAVFAPYGFTLLVVPLVLLWGGYGVRYILGKIKDGK